MKYSILVPVYNVEKYLRQCIESVLSQDFEDFELILTNDGSTDGSAVICQEYARKDSRISYYEKENEGLLLTRRYALKKAKGEYVLFLDSDDFWEDNLLAILNAEIERKDVDIVLYRYNCVDDEGFFIGSNKGIFKDGTYFDISNREELLFEFLRSSRMNSMWTKCVRKSIIDIDTDYSAFKDKKGEDLLQSISLMLNAKTYLYLDRTLVNYRLSTTGRGRNYKTKHAYDTLAVHEHVHNKLIEYGVGESLHTSHCNGFLADLCQSVLPSLPLVTTYSQYKSILSTIVAHPLYKELKRYSKHIKMTNKQKLLYELLNKRMFFVIYSAYYMRNYLKLN